MVRVLVVSENATERLRATSALEGRDVEAVEVTNSADAQRSVIDEDFDVLVIDGDMSPKGGFSLLYEIRTAGELRGEPTPPALIMLGREQDRWLASWAGANEVMLKPVDPFQLADRVVALADQDAAPAGVRESRSHVNAIIEGTGRDPEEVRSR